MAQFGRKSRERLATVHPDLQKICNKAIIYYDFTVICGHRGKDLQNAHYRSRPQRSKKQWPNSKHNKQPSLAIDLAPWPINWEDEQTFYYLAGLIMGIGHMFGIKIRWGGDFNMDGVFHDWDAGHFELIMGDN